MQVELSASERVRYSRHILLPEVGVEGQKKLRAARVLCVGTGGLGSPVLLYLAAAGVGTLGVIDFDRVDLSNLQRQIIHSSDGVGTSKVSSAAARLHALDPGVRVEPWDVALDKGNALDILGKYDIVVDGTDNFPTRYLIDDACAALGIPYVHGSIFKFEGQVSVFNLRGGPRYRDLFPEPPPPGAVPSCGEAGVLGVLPGVIGTLQATEVIKLILGIGAPLSGRVLIYDALSMTFDEVRLAADPDRAPVTTLGIDEALCVVPPPSGVLVDAAEVMARRAAGWNPFVLDVRTAVEHAESRMPDVAARVDHDAVGPDDLPAAGDVLVVCRSGGRAAAAIRRLVASGVDPGRLYLLSGGMLAWETSR
jgi:molybdopterin/thiamine biosynthesis adenylyltransferase/rhodanese-related sulfurtransferase